MSKNKKNELSNERTHENSSDKMIKAINAVSVDNQNVNQNHNTKKESLGKNTKR